MSGIFISYRREQTWLHAHQIYSALKPHFRVIKDVDTIEPGEDWEEKIRETVGSCEALIAVISPPWLNATDEEGQRRLDDPDDWVRFEIATALERRIRVIPALVDDARVPKKDELPDDLAKLPSRQAFKLSKDHWDYDLERLIHKLGGGKGAAIRRAWDSIMMQKRWLAFAAALAAVVALAILVVVLIRGGDSSGGLGGGDDRVTITRIRSDALGGPGPQLIANVAVDGDSELVAVGHEVRSETDRDAAAWRSSDGGLTWRRADPTLFSGTPDQLMKDVVRLADSRFVVVGHDNRRAMVWLSGDGAGWTQVRPPSAGGDHVMNAVTAAQGAVVAVGWADGGGEAQDATAWRSTDGGQSWQVASVIDSRKAENQQIKDVVSTRAGKLIGVGYDNRLFDGMVWRSADGGKSWEGRPVRDRDSEQMSSVASGEFGLVAVGFADGADRDAAVWRSTDGGESWQRVARNELEQVGSQEMFSVVATDEALVAAGVEKPGDAPARIAFWRSTDGGAKWERILLTREEAGSAAALAPLESPVALGQAPGPDDQDAAVWTTDR